MTDGNRTVSYAAWLRGRAVPRSLPAARRVLHVVALVFGYFNLAVLALAGVFAVVPASVVRWVCFLALVACVASVGRRVWLRRRAARGDAP